MSEWNERMVNYFTHFTRFKPKLDTFSHDYWPKERDFTHLWLDFSHLGPRRWPNLWLDCPNEASNGRILAKITPISLKIATNQAKIDHFRLNSTQKRPILRIEPQKIEDFGRFLIGQNDWKRLFSQKIEDFGRF